MTSGAKTSMAALSAALLLAGCGAAERPAVSGQDDRAVAETPREQNGPEVRFADLDGLRAALSARQREGRPVLLNFWATWCLPCVEELPDLAAVSREFGDAGPELLGVSLDGWVIGSEPEAEEKVRAALRESGVTYTNLIYRGDQDPLLSGFDLPGPIPYSVLYDGEGRAIASWSEKVPIDELRRAAAALP